MCFRAEWGEILEDDAENRPGGWEFRRILLPHRQKNRKNVRPDPQKIHDTNLREMSWNFPPDFHPIFLAITSDFAGCPSVFTPGSARKHRNTAIPHVGVCLPVGHFDLLLTAKMPTGLAGDRLHKHLLQVLWSFWVPFTPPPPKKIRKMSGPTPRKLP